MSVSRRLLPYLLSGFFLLLHATVARAAAPAPARPNFIVVLIDDMGWEDFSCFGNKDARTPVVDRLAAEGIRFSQFYVNSPICSPSRTAITTGQYPQRWRITSFLNNRAENERRGMAQWLDPRAPTLARALQSAGYATGHFGKWHMGGQRDVDDAPPITAYGFDRSLTNFEGMGPKLLPLTLKPGDTKAGRIWEDAERLGGPATWVQRSTITTGFAQAALAFIDASAREKKPFFVNLWPDDVHSPFWPPIDKWSETKRGLYLSVLQEFDRQLGTLVDRVRGDPALRDNTFILVFSDNGHEPGAGRGGVFRGAKGSLFEGGTRSPLVVWGPGLIPAARAGTHDATSVFAAFDLAPSLLRLAGVAAPNGTAFDGEDLSATLTGRAPASRRAPICWRRPPDRKNVPGTELGAAPDLAIRDGRWKLLCDYDGSRPRLHDLDADPSESNDLAAREPALVQRLTAAVLAWHRSMPPDNGATYTAPTPAQKKKAKQAAK
jgi:arylsulfatase A-like enzyme